MDHELIRAIERAIQGYIPSVARVRPSLVFRARRNPTFIPFNSYNDLWYPPRSLVSSLGRFNGVGDSVFYCSSSLPAAIWELGPKPGDIFTVLVAAARNERAWQNVARLGCESFLHPFAEGVGSFTPAIEAIRMAPQNTKEKCLSELAAARCKQEYRQSIYHFTNKLAKAVRRNTSLDGIMYPALEFEMMALNVVLWPRSADRLLIPAEVWMIEVVDKTFFIPGVQITGRPFFKMRAIGKASDVDELGRLRWKLQPSGFSVHMVRASIGSSVDKNQREWSLDFGKIPAQTGYERSLLNKGV